MPIHQLKLLNQFVAARNTVVLQFTKPEGFIFKPGQYGGFTLINPTETDSSGITRRFSLLSTPDDPHIAIVTRIQQSAFKRVLISLPIGSEIKFAGPTGNFILHEDINIPAVFIAGGIGIAPFYSMLKYVIQHEKERQCYLFYGNQCEADTAFFEELSRLAKEHTHFKLIPVFNQPSNTWQGETGFITHTILKKYIPNLSLPIYYVCGSPAMVTVLQETLAEMGIDEQKIRVEDFPGY